MKLAKTYCLLQQSLELNNSITKCTPNEKASHLRLHHNLCSFAEISGGQNINTGKYSKMNPSPSYAPLSNYSVFLKIASSTYLTTKAFNFISTTAFIPNQRAG